MLDADPGPAGVNWAGSYTYRAERLHRPSSLEQLREIVATAPQIRVLGSRHCIHRDRRRGGALTLDDLPADIVVDRAARTVSCSAAVRYGALAEALEPEDSHFATSRRCRTSPWRAPSPRRPTARVTRTATSPPQVAALELVTSDGELVTSARGDDDFDGLVVGLGALGAVTRVTLDVVPAYGVRQRVFEDLRWEALLEHFDAITASGYSVSVFTRLDETASIRSGSGPGSPRSPSRSATSSSARGPRPRSGTRSAASTRSTARRSWVGPGPGQTACRTSAWDSRPATARRSNPSS